VQNKRFCALPAQKLRIKRAKDLTIRSAAAIAALLAITAAALSGCQGHPASSGPPMVTLTIDRAHPGRAVPADFLGLSFEASVLASTWFDPGRSNLPALLKDLGAGSLRFGGNSLDRVTAWTPDATTPLPPWAHARVTPSDLQRLGALTAATGWRVDLGVTLGHPDPAPAAQEAAAAKQLIGAGLDTIQIGNEPDLFAADRVLEPDGYTYRTYLQQVAAYQRAMGPGIRFSGPDTAGGDWLARYARDEGAQVSFLTRHFYPLTRCGGQKPTIDELLKSLATVPAPGARIDETNSASCGGQDGVSNTLASALWMVAFLVNAAANGTPGVNIQGGLAACRGYTPLCVPGATGPTPDTAPGVEPVADLSLGAAPNVSGELTVQPDFYGLLLVRQLEGGRWLTTNANRKTTLTRRALLMPDGSTRVVIVNPDANRAWHVHVAGGQRTASVLRLTGPSLGATSGVRFGGSQVASDGRFDVPVGERLTRPDLIVGPASAVLLTVGPQGP
jgi:hypothetical protein